MKISEYDIIFNSLNLTRIVITPCKYYVKLKYDNGKYINFKLSYYLIFREYIVIANNYSFFDNYLYIFYNENNFYKRYSKSDKITKQDDLFIIKDMVNIK